MPSINIYAIKPSALDDIVSSSGLLRAVDAEDSRLLNFGSDTNCTNSLRIHAFSLMELEGLVGEVDFPGSEALASFLKYFGEEHLHQDLDFKASDGIAGSYAHTTLATISKILSRVQWPAFEAAALAEGDGQVSAEDMVAYVKELARFLVAAADRRDDVVVVI